MMSNFFWEMSNFFYEMSNFFWEMSNFFLGNVQLFSTFTVLNFELSAKSSLSFSLSLFSILVHSEFVIVLEFVPLNFENSWLFESIERNLGLCFSLLISLICWVLTIEWERDSAKLLLEIITPFSLATQSRILSSFWIIFSLLRPESDSSTIFLIFLKRRWYCICDKGIS